MGLLGSNVLGPFQIGYKFAIKKKNTKFDNTM